MRQLSVQRLVVLSGAVWAVCVTCLVAAQPQTVWSGIYSEAQAYRGEKIADTSCIGCHGAGLAGGDSGPKLAGEMFLANWNGQSVAELFDWVFESMPEDAPGTLTKEQASAVLAYILKLNRMPTGKQDLSSDRAVLARIQIVAAKP